MFFVDKDLTSWFIPEELIKATKKSKARLISEINKPVIAFLEGLGIKSFYISNLLRMYVIFNATVPVVFEDMVFSDDLLSLENLSLDLCFYSKGDLASLNQLYENLEERSQKYPVALYINPMASKREIMDFLSRNWWAVTGNSSKAQPFNPTKTRKKKNKSRDDFIYENRSLPRKKIMSLVTDKFKETLDYGHIGKIISLEKKRRENK